MYLHTSPGEIEKIENDGVFGRFLFFVRGDSVSDAYEMAACDTMCYGIDEENVNLIEASQIFYHENAQALDPLIAELAAKYDIDEDTAQNLIDESESFYDIDSNVEPEDLGEASWDIQHFTARAAKMLGFDGVEVTDEQGTSYMIDASNCEMRRV